MGHHPRQSCQEKGDYLGYVEPDLHSSIEVEIVVRRGCGQKHGGADHGSSSRMAS